MTGHVAMLISNGYGPDVRAQKEAHTLALAGYRVTIIAWDRTVAAPVHEIEHIPPVLDRALADWPLRAVAEPQPLSIVRVRVSAEYRSGRRLLWRIPGAWWRMVAELRRAQPDIVHAHDLDMLPLAYAFGRMAGLPVVFDAREYYPGMVRANVGRVLSTALEYLDRWLAPRADVVLTVGERLADRYRAFGSNVRIVHNSQPLLDPVAVGAAGHALRARLGVPDDALLIVYAGMWNPDRLLEPLLEAVPAVEGVWLALAGAGPLADQIAATAARCPRVCVLGWIPLGTVPELVSAGDVVYYGLEAGNPNSHFFMPNLAFFAFGVGRPLLTTPVGEIAEVVQQTQTGWVMAQSTASAARQALVDLLTCSERDAVATRSANLGQGRYNWSYAAIQLCAAYAQLGCHSRISVKNCQ